MIKSLIRIIKDAGKMVVVNIRSMPFYQLQ